MNKILYLSKKQIVRLSLQACLKFLHSMEM
jgi:hypothetical protein